jgi:uncharacterized protein DUF3237
MKQTRAVFFFVVLALIVTSFAFVSAQDDTDQEHGLESEFLFDLYMDVPPYSEWLTFGEGPYGQRIFVSINGGTVEGTEVNGEVLPGGLETGFTRPDGVFELENRLTIRTDDGNLIYVTYRGIVFTPPGTEDLYRRISLRFDTGAEEYSWLNRILAVGVGVPSQGVYEDRVQIAFKVYAIK